VFEKIIKKIRMKTFINKLQITACYLAMGILVFLQMIPYCIYEGMRFCHLKLDGRIKKLQNLQQHE